MRGGRARIDTEILHEEAVIHTAMRTRSGHLTAEVRVIGSVRVDGKKYEFNRVVTLALKPEQEKQEHPKL